MKWQGGDGEMENGSERCVVAARFTRYSTEYYLLTPKSCAYT